MTDREIQDVVVWDNGTVQVFDAHGRELPQYGGHYTRVAPSLVLEADAMASFYRGAGDGPPGETRFIGRAGFRALEFPAAPR